MMEQAIFTNMCMIENDLGQVVIQNRRNPNWPGVTFPGGHVEAGESFHDSVIREVLEETGLTIMHPKLCGVKQFQTVDYHRYVVFLYKTTIFSGTLTHSVEGEVSWHSKKKLADLPLAKDFLHLLKIFEDDTLSEFFYHRLDDQPEILLL